MTESAHFFFFHQCGRFDGQGGCSQDGGGCGPGALIESCQEATAAETQHFLCTSAASLSAARAGGHCVVCGGCVWRDEVGCRSKSAQPRALPLGLVHKNLEHLGRVQSVSRQPHPDPGPGSYKKRTQRARYRDRGLALDYLKRLFYDCKPGRWVGGNKSVTTDFRIRLHLKLF